VNDQDSEGKQGPADQPIAESRPAEPGGSEQRQRLSVARPMREIRAPADRILPPMGRVGAFFQLLVVMGVWLGLLLWAKSAPPETVPPVEKRGYLIYVSVLIQGLLALGLIAGTLWVSGQSWRTIGFTWRKTLGHEAGWAALGLMAVYGILLLSGVALMFLPEEYVNQIVQERKELFETFPAIPFAAVATVMMFVGIYEEVLFRGLILTRLRLVLGDWRGNWATAVVLSSALFGVLHLYEGYVAVVQIALVSLVFSVLFIYRGSLIAPILAHAAFNTINMTLAFNEDLQKFLQDYQPAQTILAILLGG